MGSDIAMLYDQARLRGDHEIDSLNVGFDEDWMRRADLPPMQNGEPEVPGPIRHILPGVVWIVRGGMFEEERQRRKAEGHDREAARAWMRQQEAAREANNG